MNKTKQKEHLEAKLQELRKRLIQIELKMKENITYEIINQRNNLLMDIYTVQSHIDHLYDRGFYQPEIHIDIQ